jgi:ATP-dependent DNA helicase RecG
MDLDQLNALVAVGESETAEFKQTTGERRDAAQTLCAMLNTRGGRVFFGVTPARAVNGQQVGDQTIEDVVQEIRQIEPPVFPSIDRVVVASGREVLVVTISQGQAAPYSYRGRSYRRVGNTTLPLSRDEYNRILFDRLHGEERWENRVADGWTIDDLDVAEITRTVEECIRRGRVEEPGTRDPMGLLRGLGLLDGAGLLRAAAILFGRRTVLETRFPQCMLRVARFRGTDRSEFIDNRQFHGNAFELLSAAEQFLRASLPIAGRIRPGLFERVDDPLYPPVALREALANAFCHRDYSIGGGSVAVAIYDDRLEVTSSGTLHFGLTAEALLLPHESLPFNPLVARVFYRRGIIEAWGRGTLKMVETIAQAGLVPPQIEEGGGAVTVRFRATRTLPTLSPRQERVLEILANHPSGLALRDLLGEVVGTERQLKEDLAKLRSGGLIRLQGHARGARWFRS